MSEFEVGDHGEEVAKILLDIDCVQFNFKDLFTYASGIKGPIYTNCRRLISFPGERSKIADFFVEMIKKSVPDYADQLICGMASAGVPHAALVADRLGIGMVYNRKQPKGHGLNTMIEGVEVKGKKVIIIEDHVTTAGSILKVVEMLRNEGAEVTDAFSIFTYNIDGAWAIVEKQGVVLHTLSTFDVLIKVAEQSKKISDDEMSKALEWRDRQNRE